MARHQIMRITDHGIYFDVIQYPDRTFRVISKWYDGGWRRKQVAKLPDLVTVLNLFRGFYMAGVDTRTKGERDKWFEESKRR